MMVLYGPSWAIGVFVVALAGGPCLKAADAQGSRDILPPSAWRPLAVGAGGYLSGISIAPDGTMVVRTDTYGAYVWNKSRWQQLVTATSMPEMFRTPQAIANSQGVYEIQIAPSDPAVMYMSYEGHVLRSTDKGSTWTETAFVPVTMNPGDAYKGYGQKIAIDPNNPRKAFVGTPQNGLFVTTTGGEAWQSISAIPPSLKDKAGLSGITGILFDPSVGVRGTVTDKLLAASYGNGVYESTDGGSSWQLLSGSPPQVCYAAVSSSGVYYATSDDGSKKSSLWSYANNKWTELLSAHSGDIHSVAINPANSAEIVVQGWSGNINISYNGGSTWTGFNAARKLVATDIPWLSNSGQWMSIGGTVFNPQVPNELVASAGVGVWTTDLSPSRDGVYRTVVWTSKSAGIEQLVANAIVVPLAVIRLSLLGTGRSSL